MFNGRLKSTLLSIISIKKGLTKCESFFNSGRRDCLDLFALNVPTCFATEFSTLCKSTPHSAHRSLELDKVLAHLEFSSLSFQLKKDPPNVNPLLINGRRDSCLDRSHLTAIPHFASRTLSNRKTAPASARSRNSLCRSFESLIYLKLKEVRINLTSFN